MYLKDVELLATQLIYKHIPDWGFKFNNRLNALGVCDYNTKTIYISRVAEKQTLEMVRDTILHEIAHALTPGDGHGFQWADKCKELGCKPFALFHESDYDRNRLLPSTKNNTNTSDSNSTIIPNGMDSVQVNEEKVNDNDNHSGLVSSISNGSKPDRNSNPDVQYNSSDQNSSNEKVEGTPYFCGNCLKEETVQKIIGKFARLSCKHLVIYKTHVIVPIVPKDNFLEDFFNKKTGDRAKPFQVEGIKFIEHSGFKCLIADEMGLGKTIQALGGLKQFEAKFCPCLIIVKSSLKIQWFVQILNWLGPDFIPQIIEDGKNLPVEGFNVYIASYDIFRRFSTKVVKTTKSDYGHEITKEVKENPFYDFPFKGVILDEVQSIKGNSKRTDEVRRICDNRESILALSGTPIKNNAAEYFTILNILRPDLFPTLKGYLSQWVEVEIKKGIPSYKGIRYPEDFKEYTKDFVIRRTREEVLPDLPKINRIFYHVDFETAKLKSQYEAAENDFIRMMESGAKRDVVNIIAAITVARHLVGIGKIIPTVDKIKEFLDNTDRKVIVAAHHEDVQKTIVNLTSEYCKEIGKPLPMHYHSGLNSNQRQDLINDFVTSKAQILLGSTLAMGEGVDKLQRVCHDLIFVERQWNPANEEQFEGRLVRMGQESDHIDGIYMVVTGTIDEYFTDIVESKRRYMKQALEGKDIGWSEAGLLQELYEAIASKGRKKLVRGF